LPDCSPALGIAEFGDWVREVVATALCDRW
jgi:hypothetical protein